MRLKKFNEDKVKQEIGSLNSELSMVKQEISQIKERINETYKSQDEVARSGVAGEMLHFYPRFIQGLKEDLQNKINLKYSLDKKIERKKIDLAQARGDVKVIEGMKSKDINKFKKKVNKKLEEDIEEILQMQKISKESLL